MATISIHADAEEIEVGQMVPNNDCLSVDVTKYLTDQPGTVYQRDTLYLHGNPAAIRAFASRLLAALPAEVPVARE